MPLFNGKRPGTMMSGPIRSKRHNGTVGFGGTEGRQVTVTVTALASLAAQNVAIVDSDLLPGDVILASPNTAPEAGLAIDCCYVTSEGNGVIKLRNGGAGALTGGSLTLNYYICR